MKNILIISPHFPPSNLAAVHRGRLFAMHLPAYGWKPIILTVHENFYEEEADENLVQLLPEGLQIEKVNAFPVTRPRLVGDIGLRGFLQLYRRAKQLIKNESVDFVYILIPSFYTALLGRWLHRSTGVPYGIDYIDPWVHLFAGSEKKWSRHWWSTRVAGWLEPIAVKKASLITGVAEGYYKGVQERNPKLVASCVFGAMPYGGEPKDHEQLNYLNLTPYLFSKKAHKLQLVYAGAMLPKAYEPLEKIFQSIRDHQSTFESLEIHFIGTGKRPNDPESYNIRPIAERYGLWNRIVFEYPKRIPYLDVLIHLQASDGIFILGSTEPHYTPSKVFQAILSHKPILAVLHKDSTALQVIREAGAGQAYALDPENLDVLIREFPLLFISYLKWKDQFNPSMVKMEAFEAYSASSVTGRLAGLLNQALNNSRI